MPDIHTQGDAEASPTFTARLYDQELQVLWSWHRARADFFAERDDEPLANLHSVRCYELETLRPVGVGTSPWRRRRLRQKLFGWMSQIRSSP